LPEPQGQDSEAGADEMAVGLVDMEGVMAGQEGGGGKCGVRGRTGRGIGNRSSFSFSYSFSSLRSGREPRTRTSMRTRMRAAERIAWRSPLRTNHRVQARCYAEQESGGAGDLKAEEAFQAGAEGA
jgi:hypothetical protein